MMRRFWTIAVLGLTLLVIPAGLRAQSSSTGLVVPCDTTVINVSKTDANGVTTITKEFADPCGVDSFIQQFIILSDYGLSIVVVLAMLMLLYGGFQFITAGGRASKIDEGKRVILGTVIGIIISLTAFVIVNFTVGALTGSSLTSKNLNPFGAIARVFSGQKGLERPFNSTGQPTGKTACNGINSTWDRGCANQIHCADTSSTAGPIHDIQVKLALHNCSISKVDGCYGTETFTAVRNFQIANHLAPTGQLDDRTQTLLTGGGGQDCTADAATTARISEVSADLPAPQDNSGPADQLGCCVVRKDSNPVFCADQVSARTCTANGGASTDFHVGVTSCAQDAATSADCGYCYSGQGVCFQTATSYWCANNVKNPNDPTAQESFVAGRNCNGENICSNGCSTELKNTP